MSLRINQNISAMSAHRYLTSNDANMSKQIEKLSSGLRINSAADDAAGLVISENLRTQISGLSQASQNTQDGINMIKTAEAALNEIGVQLRNIRDLTVNAANTNGNTQMLVANQAQITQGLASINRIADQTEFAGIKLLGSSNISGKQFQVGANAQQVAQFSLTGVTYDNVALTADMHASALGLTSAKNASATASKAFVGIGAADPVTKESFSVVWTTAGGTVKTANVALNNATGDTLANAVTAINTALNDAANIEAVATDSTGDSTAVTKNFLTIRQKVAGDQDAKASVVVLTDHSSTNTATGFTSSPITSNGRSSSQSIDVSAAAANFDNILNQIDTAMKMVNGLRVNLGAFQKNNMESNLASLSVAKENISASESAIRDTDMASEMVSFTKSQILMQASQAMLTQANQAPQGILQMLK
jgi:flagellin